MVRFETGAADVSRPAGWDGVCAAAREAAGDPIAALRIAPAVGELLDRPGTGRTLQLWQSLADLAAIDLTVARALEPHVDALAILAEAPGGGLRDSTDEATWGVFAAEGPGTRLDATTRDDGFLLNGRKPWCSLASHLDRALITAWTSQSTRRLFAVDLHHPGVSAAEAPWAARGLAQVVSVPVDFDEVPATPVGEDGWYLNRPGFAWGGIGVAAIWWGGAAGIARSMLSSATSRDPDQISRMLLGEADTRLHAAAAVLAQAAHAVDSGGLQGSGVWASALRVRHLVHDACEAVLRCAAHGLGPGPLTLDEEHARRVSDLEVYLRQHKAERDAATVGDALLTGMESTWA